MAQQENVSNYAEFFAWLENNVTHQPENQSKQHVFEKKESCAVDDPLVVLQKRFEQELEVLKRDILCMKETKEATKIKERVFQNSFSSKEKEQEYLARIKSQFAENSTALSGITFICLSGIYGAGKDTVASCIRQLLNSYNVNVRNVAFASSLKDSVSSIFCMDRQLLENQTTEARLWLEDRNTEDALFWSTVLLSSLYNSEPTSRYHDYAETQLYELTDSEIKVKIQDPEFRQKYPGIKLEYDLLSKQEKSEEKIQTLVDSRIKMVRECGSDLIEIMNYMKPEEQFIRNISAENVSISPNRFPLTPRNVLETTGTDCFRKFVSPDIFVLSEIRRIIKEKKNCTNGKPFVVILPDARFLNEVILPATFGAKVLFIYIERPAVLQSNPIFQKLDSFIESYIGGSNDTNSSGIVFSKMHKRMVPSLDTCKRQIHEIIKQLNEEKTKAGLPLYENIPDVRWSPVLLKYMMRETYSEEFRDYNLKNKTDVFYTRLNNKEVDMQDSAAFGSHLTSICTSILKSLNKCGALDRWECTL